MGQAIGRYQMIEDGDRIVVGLSGGKDSLTMLWLLNEWLARVPIDYSLFPVFVNPCPSADRSKRQEIKTLLNTLYRQNRKIRGNIFRAMHHVNPDYLPRPHIPSRKKKKK